MSSRCHVTRTSKARDINAAKSAAPFCLVGIHALSHAEIARRERPVRSWLKTTSPASSHVVDHTRLVPIHVRKRVTAMSLAHCALLRVKSAAATLLVRRSAMSRAPHAPKQTAHLIASTAVVQCLARLLATMCLAVSVVVVCSNVGINGMLLFSSHMTIILTIHPAPRSAERNVLLPSIVISARPERSRTGLPT